MPTLSSGVAIVEAASPDQLDDLLSSGLQTFTVRRLGATAVQVDHAQLDLLRKLLKQLGQTPRIVGGSS